MVHNWSIAVAIGVFLACATSSPLSETRVSKDHFDISDIDTAKAAVRLFVRVIRERKERSVVFILPADAPSEVRHAIEEVAPIVQINQKAPGERIVYAYLQDFVVSSRQGHIWVDLNTDSRINPKCLRGGGLGIEFSRVDDNVTLGTYTETAYLPLC